MIAKWLFLIVICVGYGNSIKDYPVDLFSKPNLIKKGEFPEALSIVLTAHGTVMGNFVQEKHLDGFTRPMISKGDFRLNSNRNIIWNVTYPSDRCYDLPLVKNYESEKNSNCNHKVSRKIKKLFLKLLLTNNKSQQKIFNKFEIFFVKKANKWFLGITPQKRKYKKYFQKIVIEGEDSIDKIWVQSKEGDFTIIRFHLLDSMKIEP